MTDLKIPRIPNYPFTYEAPTAEWVAYLIRELRRRDTEVNTALSIYELTDTFAIDSTGVKTVTINYVFGFTPSLQHCQIAVVSSTAVTDWAFNSVYISSISATQAVAKVNVATASATGGAVARVNIWVRP